jgi:hypothetical protein
MTNEDEGLIARAITKLIVAFELLVAWLKAFDEPE